MADEIPDAESREALPKTVRVTVEGKHVYAEFPFYKPLSVRLRPRLGGLWQGEHARWRFPKAREKEVRAALIQTFGTDGTVPLETVDLLVRVGRGGLSVCSEELWVLGTRVALRTARNSPVRFYYGVRLFSGPDFPESYGSKQHPMIGGPDEERELHIEAVPSKIALAAIVQAPGIYRLYAPPSAHPAPEPQPLVPSREARSSLVDRLERASARLAEVGAELAAILAEIKG